MADMVSWWSDLLLSDAVSLSVIKKHTETNIILKCYSAVNELFRKVLKIWFIKVQ